MPIPGPGVAISINTIVGEFGGTAPHSLSEYYRGGGLVPNTPTNSAIPTSGDISLGNFYGATSRIAVPLVLSAPAFNYDVYTNRGPLYVPGISDITVTVNPGVTIGSTSTGTAAMIVPNAFSPGDAVTIVNNGLIQGMGGGGGGGGPASPAFNSNPGGPGAGGGNALSVSRSVTVDNPGTLASGGGGGGGGGGRGSGVSGGSGGGGGGGGAGTNGGGGGSGGTAPFGSSGGSPGTSPAGGGGGSSGPHPLGNIGGPGGPGGGRGANGASGTSSLLAGGGAGGAAGNYIVGNPFVTWTNTGTRQGGVA